MLTNIKFVVELNLSIPERIIDACSFAALLLPINGVICKMI